MPICRTCKARKPQDNFYRKKETKNGYSSECIECTRTRKSKWTAKKSKAFKRPPLVEQFKW